MPTPVSEDGRLRLAYDEGVRVLAQQRDDLERLRARVVTLVSVASVAAGLLGGLLGPKTPRHSVGFYAGLAFFAVLVLCVCTILAPWRTIFENDPRVIVEDYVDAGFDLDATLRWSAYYAGVNSDTNSKILDRLGRVYLAAVLALGGVVISFALALATRK